VVVLGGGGGLSEAVAVPWDAVLALPENVELDTGGLFFPFSTLRKVLTETALVEPLSVAWHAVSASPLLDIGAKNAAADPSVSQSSKSSSHTEPGKLS
jgi:threonine dehydrogenase-like Zn-dependent dehydrogenase